MTNKVHYRPLNIKLIKKVKMPPRGILGLRETYLLRDIISGLYCTFKLATSGEFEGTVR